MQKPSVDKGWDSVKNAEFQAHCLLKNPKVKQAIELAMYEREQGRR